MKTTQKPLVSPLLQRQQFRRPLAVAVSAACGVVGSMSISAPALSQGLEEVLVTATRRAESVQDIPMSVSVLGEAQLTDLNVTDMEAMGAFMSSPEELQWDKDNGCEYTVYGMEEMTE